MLPGHNVSTGSAATFLAFKGISDVSLDALTHQLESGLDKRSRCSDRPGVLKLDREFLRSKLHLPVGVESHRLDPSICQVCLICPPNWQPGPTELDLGVIFGCSSLPKACALPHLVTL